jgi:hypothetical protein
MQKKNSNGICLKSIGRLSDRKTILGRSWAICQRVGHEVLLLANSRLQRIRVVAHIDRCSRLKTR